MIKVTNEKHWLQEISQKIPNNVLIRNERNAMTTLKFYSEAESLAELLKSNGLGKNDHVGIFLHHGYEYFAFINAVWFLGAIPVLLNIRLSWNEIEEQLKSASINYLITDHEISAATKFDLINLKIIYTDEINIERQSTKSNIEFYKFNIHNSALVMFTSGSSGKPKGVVHTFKSLFESVVAMDELFNLNSYDVWLSSLPLYHVGGFMILIRALLSESTITFPESLQYDDLVKAIAKLRPTHFSTVSTTLKRFIDDKISPPDNLNYLFLGGGYLDSEFCLDANSKGWKIVKVYGSTETCSMVTALSPNLLLENPSSVGKTIGKNKIKIFSIESEHQHIEDYNYGEIAVSSPSLFKEYLNDEELTAQKVQNDFYFTGDYGWIDENGFLFIDARRENIIVTGGENVSAFEVENSLKSINGITDAYVFGKEDVKWGQIVCAAVVSNNRDDNKLREQLREKISGYKIPKQFFFIDTISRNEMGKIDRRKILNLLT